MSSDEDIYHKAYGIALVTLRNRIIALEETVAEMSNNIDAATYLLKCFLESQGYKERGDT